MATGKNRRIFNGRILITFEIGICTWVISILLYPGSVNA